MVTISGIPSRSRSPTAALERLLVELSGDLKSSVIVNLGNAIGCA